MKRIREMQYAGQTILVREYDLSGPPKRAGEPRAPKEDPSPMSKKRANYRSALRKLTACINETAGPGDWFLTFTYRKDRRPGSSSEAKEHFRRRVIPELRRIYEEAGKSLWYFYKCEVGKRGGIHHHIILPYLDPLLLRSVWDPSLGGIHYKFLYSSGEYSPLAAYMLKQDNPDDPEHYNPQPGRKWSMSKTVKRPKPPKKEELKGSWERKEPYVPKGYILNPDSYYIGENPYTHRLYRSYIVYKPPLLDKKTGQAIKRPRKGKQGKIK